MLDRAGKRGHTHDRTLLPLVFGHSCLLMNISSVQNPRAKKPLDFI